jgi:hypothetical protein
VAVRAYRCPTKPQTNLTCDQLFLCRGCSVAAVIGQCRATEEPHVARLANGPLRVSQFHPRARSPRWAIGDLLGEFPHAVRLPPRLGQAWRRFTGPPLVPSKALAALSHCSKIPDCAALGVPGHRAVFATTSVGSPALVSQSGGSSSRHLTPSGAKTRSTVPLNS